MAQGSRTAERGIRRVPQFDLRRQYAVLRAEVLVALERVADSQQYILGDETLAFEREAAVFLGAAACAGCASGTDALWLALAACGVVPGDAVITTSFSFFATASSILRTGARPVFADIDPTTFNLHADSVRQILESSRGMGVRAIMPVHLYGQCADAEAFAELAADFDLRVVEDAAQAFGATWSGKHAGTLGDAAGFSFYPTKNLSAAGEAGCVTSNDEDIIERVRSLRNHGSRERYHHDVIGWNSRMDAFQAAVLRVKLRHLAAWNEQRRKNAATYDRLLSEAGLAKADDSSVPVQVPAVDKRADHIFHQYTIRARRRDELRAFLQECGVDTQIYYPLPLHLQPALSFLGYRSGDFPEAERAAAEVISLPMFPELTGDEQKYVVEGIASFYS